MSKAEVERIWLPFVPWVLVSSGVLAVRRRTPDACLPLARDGWLVPRRRTAIVSDERVRSPW